MIHVLGDLIQSIGVLVSSIVIKINPEYKLADPICTLIFAVIVFATTITILKDTFKILMEGLPVGISFENVKNDLLQIEGVMDLHDLKIWSLTIDKTFAMVHLMINKPSSRYSVGSNLVMGRAGKSRVRASLSLRKSSLIESES